VKRLPADRQRRVTRARPRERIRISLRRERETMRSAAVHSSGSAACASGEDGMPHALAADARRRRDERTCRSIQVALSAGAALAPPFQLAARCALARMLLRLLMLAASQGRALALAAGAQVDVLAHQSLVALARAREAQRDLGSRRSRAMRCCRALTARSRCQRSKLMRRIATGFRGRLRQEGLLDLRQSASSPGRVERRRGPIEVRPELGSRSRELVPRAGSERGSPSRAVERQFALAAESFERDRAVANSGSSDTKMH
jgi:hypothetical protein